MFSQTLGTALGDWTADGAGLGFGGGTLLFGGLMLLVVAAYYFTRVSRTLLFWVAFVLTRPLGAVVGDLLDKPVASGGIAISRYTVSAVLLVFIVACLLIFRQRPPVDEEWSALSGDEDHLFAVTPKKSRARRGSRNK
jgi:uncharacterized membrane-anchored protein